MEPRQLLAGDIDFGLVYYEEASGQDEAGDVFEMTFQGGQPGTQLDRVVIDTDKLGDGLSIGDTFFDTSPEWLGSFGASAFSIIDQTGIDSVGVTVTDGGTLMILDFTGFDPGDRLIFTIDVDEQGFLGPNAVAEATVPTGPQPTMAILSPGFMAMNLLPCSCLLKSYLQDCRYFDPRPGTGQARRVFARFVVCGAMTYI